MSTTHPGLRRCGQLRLNSVLPEHDLVETTVSCRDCGASHVLALPGDAPLAATLASASCPSCRLIGALVVRRVA